jgi:hypothetical protein
MKALVQQDVGNVGYVNRAVWAVCAALLKHNDLVSDALEYVRGIQNAPQQSLLKVGSREVCSCS